MATHELTCPECGTKFTIKRSRKKAHGFNRGMKSAQRPGSAAHIYHTK